MTQQKWMVQSSTNYNSTVSHTYNLHILISLKKKKKIIIFINLITIITIFYQVILHFVDRLKCLLTQSNYYYHRWRQQITDCHLYVADFWNNRKVCLPVTQIKTILNEQEIKIVLWHTFPIRDGLGNFESRL